MFGNAPPTPLHSLSFPLVSSVTKKVQTQISLVAVAPELPPPRGRLESTECPAAGLSCGRRVFPGKPGVLASGLGSGAGGDPDAPSLFPRERAFAVLKCAVTLPSLWRFCQCRWASSPVLRLPLVQSCIPERPHMPRWCCSDSQTERY